MAATLYELSKKALYEAGYNDETARFLKHMFRHDTFDFSIHGRCSDMMKNTDVSSALCYFQTHDDAECMKRYVNDDVKRTLQTREITTLLNAILEGVKCDAAKCVGYLFEMYGGLRLRFHMRNSLYVLACFHKSWQCMNLFLPYRAEHKRPSVYMTLRNRVVTSLPDADHLCKSCGSAYYGPLTGHSRCQSCDEKPYFTGKKRFVRQRVNDHQPGASCKRWIDFQDALNKFKKRYRGKKYVCLAGLTRTTGLPRNWIVKNLRFSCVFGPGPKYFSVYLFRVVHVMAQLKLRC